jgi:23S rRNA maturation-related 3'-5' exoribonuclease YhaM
MNLNPEQIKSNWDKLIQVINDEISEPRKTKLLNFYNKNEERLILMPASHKTQYHSCFPGGYIYHVLSVLDFALEIHEMWNRKNPMITYTREELVFSVINHDLGKMGDENHDAYLPSKDEWRKKNMGEMYSYNTEIAFMTVPDRSIYLLMQEGIKMSKNEILAIKLHDGLYDESNKPYLVSWMPETKPRTSIVYIIHMADLLSARMEFEQEWLPKFENVKVEKKPKPVFKAKTAALGNVKNNNLRNILNDL